MLKWTLYRRITVGSDDSAVYFGRSRVIVLPFRFESKQDGFRPIHPLRFRSSDGISRAVGCFLTDELVSNANSSIRI
jgi:hypothetical protein